MKYPEVVVGLISGIIVLYELGKQSLFSAIYTSAVFSMLAATIIIVYLDRKIKWDQYTPTVTVTVPTYNEETYISDTVEALLSQDYPKNRMKIIVFNDSSTDGTSKALERYQDRITILNSDHNMGKRKSIATIVRDHLNTKVMVLIDSDTMLDKNAVSHLVAPLKDEKIGASTGNVKVRNKNTNLLTRFQDVWYYSGFRFIRGFESHFRTVTCCSGIIAAYKSKLLKERISEFEYATFMGRPYLFGDDRDLTNLVLKDHDTVFVSDAVAYTIVPDKLSKFLKQQTRWKKGWIIGTRNVLKFMYRKNPIFSLYLHTQIILNIITPLVLLNLFFYSPIFKGAFPIYYIAGLVVVGLLYGLDQLIMTKSENWFLRPFAGLLFLPVLGLLIPFAVLSLLLIPKQKWGTR